MLNDTEMKGLERVVKCHTDRLDEGNVIRAVLSVPMCSLCYIAPSQ